MKKLKCLHISDLHEENVNDIVIPFMEESNIDKIDILFISGDLTYGGYYKKLKKIYNELLSLLDQDKVDEIVVIPGNHDIGFERQIGESSKDNPNVIIPIFKMDERIHLLLHQAKVIKGVKVFGSPWTPKFGNWAFMYEEDRADELWQFIPKYTEILITHGPPKNILDKVNNSFQLDKNVGCPALAYRVTTLPELKYHLFGHIHEGYGKIEKDGVVYMNSAIMDDRYKNSNKPQYFEY